MTYEQLLIEAEKDNLIVKDKNLLSCKGRIKGNRIAIKKDMLSCEKACVLAEELGHYHTTVGNILDQKNPNNRKQEKTARKWAVNKLISIESLIEACVSGCETLFDTAVYLDVTEDFLLEAITAFKNKYGLSYSNGTHTITFNDKGFCVTGLE